MNPPKVSRWIQTLTAAVALLVLTGAAIIALVVVGTQVGFYRLEMRTQLVDFAPLPLPTLDLPVFTPLATEGVVWMCTLMAVVLVILNKPAGRWMRAMWFFASIAAFVNTWHATQNNHDLLGGVVTGGLSIAGPFTVHLFVVWVKHIRNGRTLAEARIDTGIRWTGVARALQAVSLAVLDTAVHPGTVVRAVSVWRAYRGITYSQAWFIGSTPLRERMHQAYAARPGKACVRVDESSVHEDPPPPPDASLEDRAHGAVLTAVRADDHSVRDEVAAFLAELDDDTRVTTTVRTWSEKARAHGTTSDNTDTRTPDARAVHDEPHARVKPRAKRSRKPSRTGAKRRVTAIQDTDRTPSARDQIRAEYTRRVNAGETTDPDAVDFAALAREIGTSRTTVSRTWRERAADQGGQR